LINRRRDEDFYRQEYCHAECETGYAPTDGR
jgi:hypothetical protein